MTPEQIIEGAIQIRGPFETWSSACYRSALYLRLSELQPKWTLPDDVFDESDWFKEGKA